MVKFLSTLSLRRATSNSLRAAATLSDFYPRSPCGERLPSRAYVWLHLLISIHALLAESDNILKQRKIPKMRFLSTLSLRRATSIPEKYFNIKVFLSTLSLRRATGRVANRATQRWYISIHALLAESDWIPLDDGSLYEVFLSTLSLRRATYMTMLPAARQNVFLSTLSLRRATLISVRIAAISAFLSTLSLRRATSRAFLSSMQAMYFYPRSPCGERPYQYGNCGTCNC